MNSVIFELYVFKVNWKNMLINPCYWTQYYSIKNHAVQWSVLNTIHGLDKKILTDGRTDTEQTWRLSWAYRKWAWQWNGLQVWVRLCECRPWNTCMGGCFNIQSAYESYICYLIKFYQTHPRKCSNNITLNILATVWYCI